MLKALILMVFSSILHAEPMNMEGIWEYSGKSRPAFRVESVTHYVFTEKAKEELRQLKKSGFTCTYMKRSTYRCRRVRMETWTPSQNHLEALFERFAEYRFELVKTIGAPTLITDGDVAKQWQMPLFAYNQHGKTDSVVYWELQNTDKLHFKISGRDYWPHFITKNLMNIRVLLTEKTENGFVEFHYDGEFTKALNERP